MSRTYNSITANVLGLITFAWLVVGVVPSVFGVGGPPKDDPPNVLSQAEYPWLDFALHDNNLLWTVINNDGIIGNFFGYDFKGQNKVGPTLYYPRYSRKQYGYWLALWVGGVTRGDTLVSTALDCYDHSLNTWGWYGYPIEFWPDTCRNL